MGYGGCPSWIAANRAKKEGYSSGYDTGYSRANEELKEKFFNKLNNKFKDKILNEIKDQIKKEIKDKELEKLEKELTKKLTKEINKKLIEEMYEKLETYETKIKENPLIFLPNLNIIIEEADTNDTEMYVYKKFQDMGYKVEDCRSYGGGHPDFIFTKDERLYVEVKSEGDGLRINQAKWILNNKNKKIILYFVNRRVNGNGIV